MRILHLVSYPLYSGPLPATLGLAVAQQALGHTVWLAYDSKRGNFNGFEEAAEPHIAAHDLAPPIELTLSAKASPLQHLHDARALRSFVSAGEVDVVHTHMSHDHALMAGVRADRCIRVRTVHAARSLQARFGQRWIMRRADGWIVRCARHRDNLVQRFGIAPLRVTRVLGGIDAAPWREAGRLDKVAARARFGVPEGVALIGHVALLARRGQEQLLDAIYTLGARAPHVLFVGAGEHEQTLRRHVETLHLTQRVHFTGYLHKDELRYAYAAMDAAFLAQAGNDAAVRAALEAMAAGLPVLGVSVDALGELVRDVNGFPIARAASRDIADGLRHWLDDLEGGRTRGLRGREEVQKDRTFAAEAAQTLACYAAR